MDDETLSEAITREIIELHGVFERWFRGEGPENLERVEQVLASEFTMVPPNGTLVPRTQLMTDLLDARDSRQIDIRIEHLRLIWHSGDAALAAYDEVHHHAEYTTRRRSTALFSRAELAPNGVVWQHLHETWVQPPPR